MTRFLIFVFLFWPASAYAVTGTVTYSGAVPAMRPIAMTTDQACLKSYVGRAQPVAETVVLGENKGLANVLVRVTKGLTATTFPAPGTEAVLDQRGCLYYPKIVGVQVGQKLKILNSDPTFHNVHTLSTENLAFNLMMPQESAPQIRVFERVEDPFEVECNIHPWMKGSIAVMAHPHFAVTGPDGKFDLGDLPDGTYEIETWHARLGKKTQTVSVSRDKPGTVPFVYTPPQGVGRLDFVVIAE